MSRFPWDVVCGAALVIVMFVAAYFAARADRERLAKVEQAKAEMETIVATPESFAAILKNPRPDPWGTMYVFKQYDGVVDGFDIVSAGPDRKLGTADDIAVRAHTVNWKKAGKAAGKAAGEFGRGFLQGVQESK